MTPFKLFFILLLSTLLPVNAFSKINEETDNRLTLATSYILKTNKKLGYDVGVAFAQDAVNAADEFELDVRLLLALVTKESGWQPEAGNRGARGLSQVVATYHAPKIHKARQKFQVYSIYEPKLNLYVGAWILREALDDSPNITSALLKYNGGGDKRYPARILEEVQRVKISKL